MPPLITMLPEAPRPPYPITRDEQDRLFSKLPARLALFAVNTGLRESNVCGLEWTWEVAVPEVGRSVFVIPPEAFKSKRAHVVVLNDAAWSIVQAQRGLDPIWVFPYRDRHVNTMNNTALQRARREAGLRGVRIHDLRHTFGCRLRAAGVTAEDREALLGHANHSMAGHYASADVGRLLEQANLILDRQETRTVLRVANGPRPGLWIKGPAAGKTTPIAARKSLKIGALWPTNLGTGRLPFPCPRRHPRGRTNGRSGRTDPALAQLPRVLFYRTFSADGLLKPCQVRIEFSFGIRHRKQRCLHILDLRIVTSRRQPHPPSVPLRN
jgi:hypothetical protein